jgi:hypothetical protein
MAYSEFKLKDLSDLGVELNNSIGLFADVPEQAISEVLSNSLREGVPLALAINTEKARSEFIVAPVLLELRRQSKEPLSFFSGVEFSVDPSRGLNGICDFIVSLSAFQLAIEAPVISVLEAKRDDIGAGLAQCAASMVAAKEFNLKHHNHIPSVFGIVTTGSLWKFLRLQDNKVTVDLTEYSITQPEKLLGILLHMISVK